MSELHHLLINNSLTFDWLVDIETPDRTAQQFLKTVHPLFGVCGQGVVDLIADAIDAKPCLNAKQRGVLIRSIERCVEYHPSEQEEKALTIATWINSCSVKLTKNQKMGLL